MIPATIMGMYGWASGLFLIAVAMLAIAIIYMEPK